MALPHVSRTSQEFIAKLTAEHVSQETRGTWKSHGVASLAQLCPKLLTMLGHSVFLFVSSLAAGPLMLNGTLLLASDLKIFLPQLSTMEGMTNHQRYCDA